MPANPKLKDPKDFRLIGQEQVVAKLDTADKTNGKALFTLDVYEPDMLTVVVAHPPRFGATPQRVDDKAARAIPGVVDVKPISTGVAVYATGMWAALKGRNALKVTWDESKAEKRSSAELIDALAAKAATPGVVAASHGDVDAALKSGAMIVEAEYRFPYLAHAPMEPRNGVMKFDGAKAQARYGSQIQTLDQMQIAKIFGIAAGRCFHRNAARRRQFRSARRSGRRSAWRTLRSGPKAIGPNRSVKLVWTREDDIGGGFYRPIVVHRMRAAIDGDRIDRLERHGRQPLDRQGHRDGSDDAGEWRRQHHGRGRQGAALRHPKFPLRRAHRRWRSARPVLALGRQHPHGFRRRNLPRRTAGQDRARIRSRAVSP